MGRTNPTYRRYLEDQRKAMSGFRRALRRPAMPPYDSLFEYAERYADAAGYLNRTDAETALLFSMLLGVEAERRELAERVADLEGHVTTDG